MPKVKFLLEKILSAQHTPSFLMDLEKEENETR